LLRVAEKIGRQPGGTLPNKLAQPADYKAMDALMNRPEVTRASVLAPRVRRTQALMRAAPGAALLLHDTTELDYSGLSIPELGPIGNGGGRGYLCHNTLAVTPERRQVLGSAHQIRHRRAPVPPGEGVRAKRERAGRESRLWSRAAQALGPAPAGGQWVGVAGRGADLFEFLATEQQLGRTCVVRACHSRAIRVGHGAGGEQALLFDYLRSLPAAGRQSKKVFDRQVAAERQVPLAVAFAAVTLQPPHVKKGEYPNVPPRVGGLRSWEAKPPQGHKPLEWFVLRNSAVTPLADAWPTSSWYECR
jgi:hypothetical protein